MGELARSDGKESKVLARLTKKLLRDGFQPPGYLVIGPLKDYPEKIIQFGEGKFLRAFADWMIHEANLKGVFEGRVVVVPPRSDHLVPVINGQDGLFTLYLRGLQAGKREESRQVVASISRALSPRKQWPELVALVERNELRFIISNTTEAGIVYRPEPPYREGCCPDSFPGKLTALLYHRFHRFDGTPGSGLILLPCELLEQNGEALRNVILQLARDWDLPPQFTRWLEEENYFLNTLVDRIVTGVPPGSMEESWAQMGYRDDLLNAAEPYYLWVIAAPEKIRREFPLDRAGLNLLWVDDVRPYRTRKVRILNGAHTAVVAAALLSGIETVREAVEDKYMGNFIYGALFNEIVPALQGRAGENPQSFARDTLERFRNPFIEHRWAEISVNSIAKFRERVLPSLLDYQQLTGDLPPKLTFSFAALLALYWCGDSQGELRDDAAVLDFFAATRARAGELSLPVLRILVESALRREDFWGSDLTAVPGLAAKVLSCLEAIMVKGAKSALAEVVNTVTKKGECNG